MKSKDSNKLIVEPDVRCAISKTIPRIDNPVAKILHQPSHWCYVDANKLFKYSSGLSIYSVHMCVRVYKSIVLFFEGGGGLAGTLYGAGGGRDTRPTKIENPCFNHERDLNRSTILDIHILLYLMLVLMVQQYLQGLYEMCMLKNWRIRTNHAHTPKLTLDS